jgi:hypothetical protein
VRMVEVEEETSCNDKDGNGAEMKSGKHLDETMRTKSKVIQFGLNRC